MLTSINRGITTKRAPVPASQGEKTLSSILWHLARETCKYYLEYFVALSER